MGSTGGGRAPGLGFSMGAAGGADWTCTVTLAGPEVSTSTVRDRVEVSVGWARAGATSAAVKSVPRISLVSMSFLQLTWLGNRIEVWHGRANPPRPDDQRTMGAMYCII